MPGEAVNKENALDKAQGKEMPGVVLLLPDVCKLLLMTSSKNYRKKKIIRAAMVNSPFRVDDGKHGSAGDYLVDDNGIRVVFAGDFKRDYAPVRKPREKKQ